MEEVHRRAVHLVGQIGSDPEPPLVRSLALTAVARGDWESGREFGERLQAQAERDDDPILRVESNYALGIAAYWSGRLGPARRHFEAAMERFQPSRRRAHVLRYGQDPELIVRTRLAHTLWLLGHPREADRQRNLAMAVANESAHPYSRVAFLFSAVLAFDRRDGEGFRRHLQALEPYAMNDGPPQLRLPMELFTGYLDVLEGRTIVGLERVSGVRKQIARGPAPAPGMPGVATRVLLEGYSLAGEPQAGLALADEALGMGRGAELWEAEIRRLRATFLAGLGGGHDEVAAELERALAVARRQRARAFEQRIRETLAERSPSHDRAI
jgi:hypothetical protein